MNPKTRLRLLLLGVLGHVLRWRSRPLRLPPGPAMVIAPHPDDECFGCASLLAHTADPARWTITFLTSGEASHPGHPVLTPFALAARREEEARAAATALGVPEEALHFLRLPDARLDRLTPEERAAAVAALASLLVRLRPAIILVPWRHDGSTEHAAAFSLASDALRRLPEPAPPVWEFPVWAAWSPRRLLRLPLAPGTLWRHEPDDRGAAKIRALDAYASQLQPAPPWRHSVLPAHFVAAFAHGREFFLESSR